MGLRKLYEKKEQWDKLAQLLEVLVQTAYDQCVRVVSSSSFHHTVSIADPEVGAMPRSVLRLCRISCNFGRSMDPKKISTALFACSYHYHL
jgi:hypothetical protein